MNKAAILVLAMIFSAVMVVSGANICDNAPCEPQINASLGKEFTISLQSNPSTGFEWWTEFDPNYLSVMNSTLVSGNEKSGLLGVPGTKKFTFNTLSSGKTEVIMLLLTPWENGTISERKIFPINIISQAAAPKRAIVLGKGANPERTTLSKNSQQGSDSMASNTVSSGQTTMNSFGSSPNFFKNESAMETPSQVVAENTPRSYDLSSLGRTSL